MILHGLLSTSRRLIRSTLLKLRGIADYALAGLLPDLRDEDPVGDVLHGLLLDRSR